jgi:hypothetical protein
VGQFGVVSTPNSAMALTQKVVLAEIRVFRECDYELVVRFFNRRGTTINTPKMDPTLTKAP